MKCQEAVGSLNASDYYISVDLSWDGNAPVYNYTETSGVADGNVYVRNYYGSRNGNKNDQVFENIS